MVQYQDNPGRFHSSTVETLFETAIQRDMLTDLGAPSAMLDTSASPVSYTHLRAHETRRHL
eukprot:1558977-Prorocentrum_lima.AAC.1